MSYPSAQKPENSLREGENCAQWEAALVDLLDGELAPEAEAAFRTHAETCESCRALLRESGAGREWVRLLGKAPPAVPDDLLGKILARTATLPIASEFAMPSAHGGSLPAPALAFARERTAGYLMTAAMAVFSVALTCSVSGFRLTDIPAAMRGSGSIPATASRQFFDTKKQVVSFYDNLLLVREVEATVEDLRQSTKAENQVHPETRKESRDKPRHPEPSASRAASAPLLASRQFMPATHPADERNNL
jgi:hypothetical protein